MKHSNSKLFVFMLLMTLCACNDDDCNCTGDIYGKWEVKEFMSIESVLYAKNDGYNPIIEFKQDGTMEFQLDANMCSGEFEIIDETAINIEDAGCTKMCCDSDFSQKFVTMVSEVGTYEIEGDKLKLHVSGWGWIELEFISN